MISFLSERVNPLRKNSPDTTGIYKIYCGTEGTSGHFFKINP